VELHVKYNYLQTILQLFQCFISHVTTSEAETEIISAAEIISKNYFSDIEHVGKYS